MWAFRRIICRRHNLLLRTDGAVHWRTASSTPTSVSERERQNFLLELSSQSSNWKVSPQSILDAVRECPELLKFSLSDWTTIFRCLQDIGFNGTETLHALQNYPRLLAADPKNIAQIWHALTVFKLNTNKLVQALIDKPHVLCNSPKDAEDKALEIINFAGAGNNALRILNVCNNPFALSLDELKKVTAYVKETMKVRRTYEICRSSVVECPLTKLKCRHSFLVDAGIYEPQDDDIPVTIPHSNALLCDIVNTEDEDFAENTAKLTYEEYIVYQELFEKKRYEEIYEDDDFD